MKVFFTVTITCSILAFATKSAGQNWLQDGSTWHYTIPPFTSYSIGYDVFTITGDTLIQDKLAKKWSGSFTCGNDSLEFLYEDDSRIYRYSKLLEEWTLLYDFDAVTGDTLIVYGNYPDEFGNVSPSFLNYVIDSVGQVIINFDTLRVQYIRPSGDNSYYYDWGSQIIEGLGSTFFLLPQLGFCDPLTIGLRCYESYDKGLYKLVDYECTYTNTIEIGYQTIPIEVYPNPASEEITIEPSVNEAFTALLFDEQGQIIHKTSVQNRTVIPLPSTKKGLLLLQLIRQDGSFGTVKILKQ